MISWQDLDQDQAKETEHSIKDRLEISKMKKGYYRMRKINLKLAKEGLKAEEEAYKAI
ncbi:hypothetical protein [Sporohalobacter salinus]|uniref:hypothetical protein n=1 Tax=Sporohalobacter salinus TaxID=1494606 RepID=UPI001960E52D|nr:hypothetical protein [Sporohalobacter salinus]MBM7624040.1 CopG family transcriptional regulator/antitoxin EndoAI [Sporohalobacter salinus]